MSLEDTVRKVPDLRGAILSHEFIWWSPTITYSMATILGVLTRRIPGYRVRSARRMEAYWPFVNACLHRTTEGGRRDGSGRGRMRRREDEPREGEDLAVFVSSPLSSILNLAISSRRKTKLLNSDFQTSRENKNISTFFLIICIIRKTMSLLNRFPFLNFQTSTVENKNFSRK